MENRPAPPPHLYLVPHDPDHRPDPLDRYEREESDLREVYRARNFIPVVGSEGPNRVAAVLMLLVLGAVMLSQIAGRG